MNRRLLQIFWLIAFSFFAQKFCFAQKANLDTLKSPAGFSAAEAFFNKEIKQQSLLYNGRSYEGHLKAVSGSPYFQSNPDFTSGTIVYNGFSYRGVPIKYDIYEDKVISLLANGVSMFSLINEKVSDFYLYQHHFIYINVADTTVNSPLKKGFYDLIYNGKSKILAKRSATMQTTTSTYGVENYFVHKAAYVLQKDNKYYKISNESSFLNLFKEKKAELKQHLRASNVKFKKDPEQAMTILITYYESLPN